MRDDSLIGYFRSSLTWCAENTISFINCPVGNQLNVRIIFHASLIFSQITKWMLCDTIILNKLVKKSTADRFLLNLLGVVVWSRTYGSSLMHPSKSETPINVGICGGPRICTQCVRRSEYIRILIRFNEIIADTGTPAQVQGSNHVTHTENRVNTNLHFISDKIVLGSVFRYSQQKRFVRIYQSSASS